MKNVFANWTVLIYDIYTTIILCIFLYIKTTY